MISEIQARIYCSEDISLIQNYAEAVADTSQMWECHHRLEIQGCFYNSPALLEKCGMYKKVPAWQLIFLTHAEHRRLHLQGNTNMLGKHHTDEAKAKMAAAMKGRKLSAEHKAKIAAANKGKLKGKYLSDQAKAKLSEALKGKPTWMKGKHHSEEARAKIAEAVKRRWQKWREEHGCI